MVTVTLRGGTSRTALTVSAGASGDAATEGTDCATVPDFTLSIAAGQISGMARFCLCPRYDYCAPAPPPGVLRRERRGSNVPARERCPRVLSPSSVRHPRVPRDWIVSRRKYANIHVPFIKESNLLYFEAQCPRQGG